MDFREWAKQYPYEAARVLGCSVDAVNMVVENLERRKESGEPEQPGYVTKRYVEAMLQNASPSTQEVRLIDANALLGPDENSDKVLVIGSGRTQGKTLAMAMELVKRKIRTAPTIDAVAVVRCRNCIHWDEKDEDFETAFCYLWGDVSKPHDYCSRGERRDEDA